MISEVSYPVPCHFLKQSFAPQFSEFYFFNPKAEEFKWWTAKFLAHGLFEFWKRLQVHQFTSMQRKETLNYRLEVFNSSSREVLEQDDFVGQVHLFAFYIIIAKLFAICIVVFLAECAMQNARQVSLLVLTKYKHFSLQLLRTVVRFLSLVSRLIILSLQKIAILC
jgi:hypothetical protein